MHLEVRSEQTGEEPKSEDVIHMKMTEQDVDASEFRREVGPEDADAGAGVEDGESAVGGLDLNARRIAPVTAGTWTGCRD
jgi:hypothetical protein